MSKTVEELFKIQAELYAKYSKASDEWQKARDLEYIKADKIKKEKRQNRFDKLVSDLNFDYYRKPYIGELAVTGSAEFKDKKIADEFIKMLSEDEGYETDFDFNYTGPGVYEFIPTGQMSFREAGDMEYTVEVNKKGCK